MASCPTPRIKHFQYPPSIRQATLAEKKTGSKATRAVREHPVGGQPAMQTGNFPGKAGQGSEMSLKIGGTGTL